MEKLHQKHHIPSDFVTSVRPPDGTVAHHRGAVPRARHRAARLPRHARLPDDRARVHVHHRQGPHRAAGVRLRVRHPVHDGGQHHHQVCAAHDRTALGHAVGEQGGVPAVHGAGDRLHPGGAVRHVRGDHGAHLHAAAVRLPADVLHDAQLQEGAERCDHVAAGHPEHEYAVPGRDGGGAEPVG